MRTQILASLAVTALSLSSLTAWAQVVGAIDQQSDPGKKLLTAQPMVAACDQSYKHSDPKDKDGMIDSLSGFKVKAMKQGGVSTVAFAGTEPSKDFAPAMLAEAKGIAAAAAKGEWRAAVALFLFSAQMPVVPLPADIRTDIELIVGIVPHQFVQAVEFARARRANGDRPVLTGHSLGGALATYSAEVIGEGEAVTFNAPYLNPWLRSHAAPKNKATVRAFQARTNDSRGLPVDPVSFFTSFEQWFGEDKCVQSIIVEVQRNDWLLHSLDNFKVDDLTLSGLRWVVAKDGVDASLDNGATIRIPGGSAVIELKSDMAKGKSDIVALGRRDGYVAAKFLQEMGKFGTVRLGRVTANDVNLRSSANTQSKVLVKLRQDVAVRIVEEVQGANVDGSTRWFHVELFVIRGGLQVPAGSVTKDPAKVERPAVRPLG